MKNCEGLKRQSCTGIPFEIKIDDVRITVYKTGDKMLIQYIIYGLDIILRIVFKTAILLSDYFRAGSSRYS